MSRMEVIEQVIIVKVLIGIDVVGAAIFGLEMSIAYSALVDAVGELRRHDRLLWKRVRDEAGPSWVRILNGWSYLSPMRRVMEQEGGLKKPNLGSVAVLFLRFKRSYKLAVVLGSVWVALNGLFAFVMLAMAFRQVGGP